MLDNNFNDITEQLMKSASVCPLCNNKNKKSSMSVKLIDRQKDRNIFYAKCNYCGAAVISVLDMASSGIGNAVVFLTDLNPSEILNLKNKKPISIDDIKNMKIKNNIN
ncbi:hypothetical protein K9M42_00905 [Patescibacteria group bacterium]|nr:hypothetical protein [Patescibacteria group bacterium]